MMSKNEDLNFTLEKADQKIIQESQRWVRENAGQPVINSNYTSPRVSTEIPDCSMPLTFDQYNACSLGCVYCAPGDSVISTPNGDKELKDIQIGDKVFSYDTNSKKVIEDIVVSTMKRRTSSILEFSLENGKVIQLTEEHPVFIKSKGWIKAKDVKENDDVIWYKYPSIAVRMQNNNPMKNKNVKEKMSKTLKSRYANGDFDDLKEKLRQSGRKAFIKYNKSKECREKNSNRMKNNNPMKNKETAKKMGATLKQKWIGIPHPNKGNKRPDVRERMLSDKNPMKNPEIKRETLKKIIHSWIKNGRVSKGELKVKILLESIGIDYIHLCTIPGKKREMVLDFFIPSQKLCIEYDGHSSHYTNKGKERDEEKEDWLWDMWGIQTIRIHRDEAFIDPEDLKSILINRGLRINI